MGIMVRPFFGQTITFSLPAPSVDHGSEIQLEDLHPFTHSVSIPATSDPATIKFEKVKVTKIFTKRKSTMNVGYCEELKFREPGGSMYCSHSQSESPASAYEVTYSYSGEPMAPDEYGRRYFTFQVYFRPEELPPALRSAISGKMKHSE